MCYDLEQQERRAIKRSKREIPQLRIKFPEDQTRDNYHTKGFAHPELCVISSEEPDLLQRFTWGLIPSWVKDEEKARELSDMCLNARGETVFDKPSFRTVLKKRCLLPVDGFFEWMTVGKSKYPHYIYMKDKEPFYLGCVYDTWVNRGSGEIINGFSIITTQANTMMARIHNSKQRMPLIIPYDSIGTWLNPTLSRTELEALIKPFDEGAMQAHAISKLITSRSMSSNVPEVTNPCHYPELSV